MATATLCGRRRLIRDFIDTLLEAHLDPDEARPTLGALADCLTDMEPTHLPRGEPLFVEPEPGRPHPTGRLRRAGAAGDAWIPLPDQGCHLRLPGQFAVRYKFEIYGDAVALALQAAPQSLVPGLVRGSVEVPIDRLIMDPMVVMILMPDHCRHHDVEMLIS